MKVSLLSITALSFLIITSCGGNGSGDGDKTTDTTAIDTSAQEVNYVLDTTASRVSWAGTMIGVKTHRGTLNFKSGALTTEGGKLTGGEFTVDMLHYMMTDSNYAPDGSPQGTKANLMGHLMSEEFFDAQNFPTSHFKITSVEGNTAKGDFTVRDKTNPETVTDIVINEGNSGITATGKLTFNRQKYGVDWSSGVADKVVSDDIVLLIDITGKAQ